MTKKLTPLASRYAYHVQDPFKEVRGFYDKYGALHFISWETYLEECKKPKNIFHRTTFELVIPGVCLAAGFLMICFLVGQKFL